MPDAIDRTDFVWVIDWIAVGDADQAWRDWLRDHPLTADALDLGVDVVIDEGRTDRGDQRRYWLRGSAIQSGDA